MSDIEPREPIVLRIEAVLAKHQLEYGPGGRICTCGHSPQRPDPDALLTQQDVHRAHVARMLAPVMAEIGASR